MSTHHTELPGTTLLENWLFLQKKLEATYFGDTAHDHKMTYFAGATAAFTLCCNAISIGTTNETFDAIMEISREITAFAERLEEFARSKGKSPLP